MNDIRAGEYVNFSGGRFRVLALLPNRMVRILIKAFGHVTRDVPVQDVSTASSFVEATAGFPGSLATRGFNRGEKRNRRAI